MTKYFKTDGVRGLAGKDLTALMAFQIGLGLGPGRVLIAKDTRLSGDMLEHALAAGAASRGSEVYLAGVLPTAAISMLMEEGFDYGVVISASHNPAEFNGIKIFDAQGRKLDDARLEAIEEIIDGKELNVFTSPGKIHAYPKALDLYLDKLYQMSHPDLSGLRLVCDLANGSAYQAAPKALQELGAQVISLFDQPDGFNINQGCGSTSMEALSQYVKEQDVDAGLAFDGDGDRLLLVDETGAILSGDHYLYLMAKAMKENEEEIDLVVSTIMANRGLQLALEKIGLDLVRTDVGDKYVYAYMEAHDKPLGGEQSGHIIFKEHARTGDGLLSAIKFLPLLKKAKEQGKSLSQLADEITIYPQLLHNLYYEHPEKRLQDPALLNRIEALEQDLDGKARINVRASGTEPLIRIMVEAQTSEQCQEIASEIEALICADQPECQKVR